MSKAVMPKAAILYGHGINADRELADAFMAAGAQAERIPVKRLVQQPEILAQYQLLAFPGGFSFGDHLGSGLVLAHWMREHLREAIDAFVNRGGLIIGICNGFQVLVKMGVLPNLEKDWEPQVSLVHNMSGRFIDTWVPVEWNAANNSPWISGLPAMQLPVRHGEGRFIAGSQQILEQLEPGQVALRYRSNPNGSVNDIAGITDESGQILGLMPHPEAFIRMTQHPQWQRLLRAGAEVETFPTALELFSNAVKALKA